MNSVPLSDATRRLGAPPNWNHERDGICHTLEIVDLFARGATWGKTEMARTGTTGPCKPDLPIIGGGLPRRSRVRSSAAG
jgi:hypothetical protein